MQVALKQEHVYGITEIKPACVCVRLPTFLPACSVLPINTYICASSPSQFTSWNLGSLDMDLRDSLGGGRRSQVNRSITCVFNCQFGAAEASESPRSICASLARRKKDIQRWVALKLGGKKWRSFHQTGSLSSIKWHSPFSLTIPAASFTRSFSYVGFKILSVVSHQWEFLVFLMFNFLRHWQLFLELFLETCLRGNTTTTWRSRSTRVQVATRTCLNRPTILVLCSRIK